MTHMSRKNVSIIKDSLLTQEPSVICLLFRTVTIALNISVVADDESFTSSLSLQVSQNTSAGILKAAYKGQWINICSRMISSREANLACRKLGYRYNLKQLFEKPHKYYTMKLRDLQPH